MIEVKNLTKIFEDFEAIKDVSLYINKGSIYGLLGSNGAGKTTFLKTLAGIYKEDKGEVFIDNDRVFENEKLKQRVIFIPDALYFFSSYTIEDMAKFYRDIYITWNEDRYQRLQKVFKIDFNKKIHKLSKGMQRQVAFWLTLSIMPDVLILDEPLDGLDSVMRQKVKNLLIQEVAEREITIIISSHNLRELEDLCDHIAILHEGSLLMEKDMDDLKKDIHKVQVAFREPPIEESFNKINVLYKEQRGSVMLFIVRGDREKVLTHFNGYRPLLLDALPLTLEEIFIYEMGDKGYVIENVIF
ncbi:ABC transporter ATP-binding protein [Alkaliphilus peptidifermentans]|uniref:ABC-2 type transport system ATP-binding protein n=1 Tax=Alkaliphilus peptidifermentans DSM 18978 TaxID=1120976 RepID=A0A1G5GHB1_9FIRM|nr:ABC transporter ATP-binding protein [Alkaliphilus peptidifermentans]SCY50884.1 ABC-2 type transport system ATP-binding protein [Alkaliphilus peptidifermentans DSM 18978]